MSKITFGVRRWALLLATYGAVEASASTVEVLVRPGGGGVFPSFPANMCAFPGKSGTLSMMKACPPLSLLEARVGCGESPEVVEVLDYSNRPMFVDALAGVSRWMMDIADWVGFCPPRPIVLSILKGARISAAMHHGSGRSTQ